MEQLFTKRIIRNVKKHPKEENGNGRDFNHHVTIKIELRMRVRYHKVLDKIKEALTRTPKMSLITVKKLDS